MKRRSLLISLAVMFILATGGLAFWRYQQQNNLYSTDAFLLGTYIQARAYGRQAEAAVTAALERVREIEMKMSVNIPTSEVVAINQAAGGDPVIVSSDTFAVIARAVEYAEITEGAFDPTVYPLVAMWAIGSEAARVPSQAEIAAVLPLVDYRMIELDEANLTIRLQQPGMGIDLGGIAKGFAADEMARVMRQFGITRGLVNLGGDISLLGTRPDGQPWRIGLQTPDDPYGDVMAVVSLETNTIVTSGTYERFLDVGGQRYHHIIDPETGYPSAQPLLSVTVISDSAMDADALSTGLFILGLERGLEMAENMTGVEAVFVDTELQVYATTGVREILNIVDQRFELR